MVQVKWQKIATQLQLSVKMNKIVFHPYIKDICNPCHDKDHNKQHRGTQWDVPAIKNQMNKLFRKSFRNPNFGSSQWVDTSTLWALQKRLEYMAKTKQNILENQIRKTERLTFGVKEELSKRLPSCSPGCLDSFGLLKYSLSSI